jgi:regulation of enolase protein 1 (concanavalin A-like superfamily)
MVGWMAGIALGLAGATASWGAAPWIDADVGDVGVAGSSVENSGVWTLTGGGAEYFGSYADAFHFAYQPIKGNGTITARYLSRMGGDRYWNSAGVMIRQSDATGAPYVANLMSQGQGLYAPARFVADETGQYIANLSAGYAPQANLYMRLQRAGNDIAGFTSRDGQLWTQADFPPQSLPTLGETALFGIATMAVAEGKLSTARLDQVSVGSDLAVYGIQATTGDRTVQLQWRPVPNAVGYRIYRGPNNATAAQLVKITDPPITGTTYTDSGDPLVNDTVLTYAIAPVFQGAPDGPLVTVKARPVAIPAGYIASSVNEGNTIGDVTLDPATNGITLRASGDRIAEGSDQFHFYGRQQTGNFAVTVKVAKPISGQAGLMIRESLDGSARHNFLALIPNQGLYLQPRIAPRSRTWERGNEAILQPVELKLPITLKLTRKENTITAEYDLNDGQGFQPASDPITFREALPNTLYVGLAGSSQIRTQTSRTNFSDLVIQPVP